MEQPPRSPVSAHSLLAGARELSAAVATLVQNARGSARAMALLAAHCVELSLKSFLLSCGWSEDDLQNKLGHDLIKAWSAAREAGLSLDAEPPYWCQLLQTVHDRPYFGRYPPANSGLVTPNPGELQARITELIALVSSERHAA
jgi:hypothetical protein